MEFTAEINKVFGEEMAKIFAKSISEDEIKLQASGIWNKLNERGNYWHNNESEIDKMIKSKMSDLLKEEVEKITSTDEFKDEMKSIAKDMVKEIVDETHRKIVEEVSNRMMMLSVGHTESGGYFTTGLHTLITDVVSSMINK